MTDNDRQAADEAIVLAVWRWGRFWCAAALTVWRFGAAVHLMHAADYSAAAHTMAAVGVGVLATACLRLRVR